MFNKINTEISGRAALLLMAEAAGSFTPEARAKATAATLTEAAGLPGMCEATITAADLLVGLTVIYWHTAIARCRKVWEIVARDFPGDDPRALAIRETWSREAAYLTE